MALRSDTVNELPAPTPHQIRNVDVCGVLVLLRIYTVVFGAATTAIFADMSWAGAG